MPDLLVALPAEKCMRSRSRPVEIFVHHRPGHASDCRRAPPIKCSSGNLGRAPPCCTSRSNVILRTLADLIPRFCQPFGIDLDAPAGLVGYRHLAILDVVGRFCEQAVLPGIVIWPSIENSRYFPPPSIARRRCMVKSVTSPRLALCGVIGKPAAWPCGRRVACGRYRRDREYRAARYRRRACRSSAARLVIRSPARRRSPRCRAHRQPPWSVQTPSRGMAPRNVRCHCPENTSDLYRSFRREAAIGINQQRRLFA